MQDSINALRTNGVCVVKGAVPLADLERVIREMHHIVAFQLTQKRAQAVAYSGKEGLHENLRRLLALDVQRYLATLRHLSKLTSLMQLVYSSAIQNVVAKFGITHSTSPTIPVLHVMSDTLKIPGGYYGVEAHQDWPSIQGGLDSLVMWVPLFDTSVNEFPVDYIPGSHLKGLWEGENTANARKVADGTYSEEDFVAYDTKQGDAVLFTTFTVHRTRLKGCSGLRIAASTRYENPFEPHFAERNYPCAYQRTVHREFYTPDFPSPELVKNIYE